ncbi:type II toxin-antitoxin system CcdA family antitoxin [Candidatus Poriferisocius sp.]|uniref:type II toxin-antitoxin system CcdA family antitoxin n=1 Tax=Candidatus Poriferisocius sp. TaxID=3101276 RepID=UPI003B59A77C
MATTRTTFTLDQELAQQARKLRVNVSAAARQGVLDAVRSALGEADRAAYLRDREQPDEFWEEVEAWGDR